jgi:hypothetical protein
MLDALTIYAAITCSLLDQWLTMALVLLPERASALEADIDFVFRLQPISF